MATDYRFATPVLVRSMGTALVLIGLVVIAVGVAVSVLGLPTVVLTTALVVAVLLVVGVGLLATRAGWLVQLDDAGYRVRWLRGAGVKQARWQQVEDVVTASIAGHDCVVVRLRDGGTTTIPVEVLDASAATFIEDLSGRLDKGRGYRRLR